MLKTNKLLPDGNRPIVLRITENRRVSEVAIKKSVSADQWDNKAQNVSHKCQNHKSINALIDNIKVKITFYFANLAEDQSPRVSAIKDIVERLTGAVKKTPSKNLLEFFNDEIERLKSMDRLGYASVHVMTKSRLNKYMNETDLAFEDIDLNFIRKFEDWMIKKGIAVTTRSIDLRTFRTVWRNAIGKI